jgi:toxin YhaV
MITNGWQLFYFRLFAAALSELEITVAHLAKRDPKNYKSHPKTRLLASVYKAITQTVPTNPDHPNFRLGKTLGAHYSHWRRVKKGMPDRYRLFFRFNSNPIKLIVYVWFNDEDTLRKAGSKTDVYETFKRMLSRGEVPSSITHLLEQSAEVNN